MFLPEYKYFMSAAGLNHMNNHSKAFGGERWWDEKIITIGDVEVRVRYVDRKFMDGFMSTLTVDNNNFKLTYRIFNTTVLEPVLPCGRYIDFKTNEGSNDLMIVVLALPQ